MNLGRAVVRALRVYFWLLVGLSALTLVWLLNRYVNPDVVATGWFAVAGFGVLILLLLAVIRRAAS